MVNALLWLPVRVQAPKGANIHDTVLAYTAQISKEMEKLKHPGLVRDMVADLAKLQSQVAWDKNGQDMANVDEGCLVTNIAWR